MKKSVLALVLLAYLFVGALYAVKTPDWQVPDEPAHYNYIRQLAETGRFPILELGDYDQSYLGRLTSERFPPSLPLDAVEYEDHQPPLYYLLATPVYLVFDGALTPLRIFSVLLGAGVVLWAYAIATAIFPGHPLVALGTAAFVAFLPQHVAMMAGVNNDSLAEFLIGAVLWMTLRWVQNATDDSEKNRKLLTLGIMLGLGLVTKTTVIPITLAVGVAVLWVWWSKANRAWGQLFHTLALVGGPALLIAAPWWLRSVSLYGGLDIYGLANHDAVVIGQPRTDWWIETYGLRAWLERLITFTFQSFWGQFGWMGVLMPVWLYRALAVWSGALGIGFLFWLRRARDETQAAFRNTHRLVLATSVFFVVLANLYYNCTFVQHQGRYLFPALIPIALGAALAVDALLRLLRLPERLRPLAFAIPYLAMVVLDVYALWRVILPTLT